MTSPVTGECAVCGVKTDQHCSGCQGDDPLFFCSREHQKLLWKTHKVLCGHDPGYFFFAPLDEQELAIFRLIRDDPDFYRQYMQRHGQECSFADVVQAVSRPIPKEGPPDKVAYAIFQARAYIERCSAGKKRDLRELSPWQSMFSLCYETSMDVATVLNPNSRAPVDLRRLMHQLDPYFRQLLIYHTVLWRCACSAPLNNQGDIEIIQHLDYGYRAIARAVDKCHIDERVKVVLREKCAEAQEALDRLHARHDAKWPA
ncbi:hypothetical protein JCM10213_000188 [Rhodosporidiobolus nylandii]